MFEVENWNDTGYSFEWRYVNGANIQITKVWDENGNVVRVAPQMYWEMGKAIRESIKGWQAEADARAYEAANDL